MAETTHSTSSPFVYLTKTNTASRSGSWRRRATSSILRWYAKRPGSSPWSPASDGSPKTLFWTRLVPRLPQVSVLAAWSPWDSFSLYQSLQRDLPQTICSSGEFKSVRGQSEWSSDESPEDRFQSEEPRLRRRLNLKAGVSCYTHTHTLPLLY